MQPARADAANCIAALESSTRSPAAAASVVATSVQPTAASKQPATTKPSVADVTHALAKHNIEQQATISSLQKQLSASLANEDLLMRASVATASENTRVLGELDAARAAAAQCRQWLSEQSRYNSQLQSALAAAQQQKAAITNERDAARAEAERLRSEESQLRELLQHANAALERRAADTNSRLDIAAEVAAEAAEQAATQAAAAAAKASATELASLQMSLGKAKAKADRLEAARPKAGGGTSRSVQRSMVEMRAELNEQRASWAEQQAELIALRAQPGGGRRVQLPPPAPAIAVRRLKGDGERFRAETLVLLRRLVVDAKVPQRNAATALDICFTILTGRAPTAEFQIGDRLVAEAFRSSRRAGPAARGGSQCRRPQPMVGQLRHRQ